MDLMGNSSEKPKYKRWSKEVRVDDCTKRIEVEQVSNGYLISITKDYKDESGEWKYETVKKVSLDNPFDKKDTEEEETGDSMFDGILESAKDSLF